LTPEQLVAARAQLTLEGFAGRAVESGADGTPADGQLAVLRVDAAAASGAQGPAEAQPDSTFFSRMRFRAAARREADARRGVLRDNLAELQSESTARARAMEKTLSPHEYGYMQPRDAERQVGDALSPATRAAAGLRVNHHKIHKADVKPIERETDASAWYALIRARHRDARGERPGLAFVLRVCGAIVAAEVADGMGFARRTYQELARWAGCCSRTVERCVRFLETHNLLDTLNVLYRTTDGALWRDANIYVPTIDRPLAPLPADVKGADPVRSMAMSRVFGGLSRLAALFGLRQRPWGLNATPISPTRSSFWAGLAPLGLNNTS
jgi:hypothetical protein